MTIKFRALTKQNNTRPLPLPYLMSQTTLQPNISMCHFCRSWLHLQFTIIPALSIFCFVLLTTPGIEEFFLSFPVWQHLSWDFHTLMRQILICSDTFKTHPALPSPIILSFLPCLVGLALLFMRPSITSLFLCLSSPLCVWCG